MTNLLSTDTGRQTLNRIACFLGRSRMSKALERTFYRAFDAWRTAEQLTPGSGYFSIETLLGELNEVSQDEIAFINTLLGRMGCIDGQTVAEMTIYVDPTNGSDVEGDGSSSQPYASLDFLKHSSFPKFINHPVRILLLGDFETDLLTFNQVLGKDGSISIMGVGAPTVLTTSAGAGPFTLTGSTGYVTPAAAFKFTVADTFGVDELYGKWIRFETGDCAGQVLPVHSNTANDLWTRYGWTTLPSIGDTFRIVEPARTIQAQTWNLECQGPKNVNDPNEEASRFNLYNLKIDIRGAFNKENQFVARNSVTTQLSFVTLIYDNTDYSFCRLECDINQNKSYDTSGAALAASGISNLDAGILGTGTNCGLLLYRTDGISVGFVEFRIQGAANQIAAIDARGLCQVATRMDQLTRCGLGIVQSYYGASCGFYLNLLTGYAGSSSIDLYSAGPWHVDVCYFEAGGNMFRIKFGQLRVVVGNIVKGGTFTGHGFRFDEGAGAVVVNADPAALVGTGGAIHFNGGVGTVAFPIADAMQTDSLGNTFARIETA